MVREKSAQTSTPARVAPLTTRPRSPRSTRRAKVWPQTRTGLTNVKSSAIAVVPLARVCNPRMKLPGSWQATLSGGGAFGASGRRFGGRQEPAKDLGREGCSVPASGASLMAGGRESRRGMVHVGAGQESGGAASGGSPAPSLSSSSSAADWHVVHACMPASPAMMTVRAATRRKGIRQDRAGFAGRAGFRRALRAGLRPRTRMLGGSFSDGAMVAVSLTGQGLAA